MAEHEYYEVNGRQIRVRPTESGQEIDEYGNFHRQPNHFTKGFGEGENPVEADRYILFWGKGCNWSNRASIARELLGLDIEDGTTDLAIIDVAMYNAYQKEYNYDVVANQISDEDAKAIADNSYAYYIFPKDQEELRDKVDEQLKELKKDGTLTELSQKYFGQDTAPEDDQFEKTPN